MSSPNALTRFASGFLLPLRAADLLLSRRGLKRYAVLPLVANVLIYAVAATLLVWALMSWNPPEVSWEFWGPVGQWLATGVNHVTGAMKWVVGLPLILVACYFTFTIVGLVLAAPFNDILSDRVERAITLPRSERKLSAGRRAWILVLGILYALRIAAIQIVAMAITVPFLLIPVVGFVPLLVVAGYFTGIGFFDIPMARHDLEPSERRPAIRAQRPEMFGLGVAIECLFLIPFAALLILPLGVTAGTMLFCRTNWLAAFRRAHVDPPDGFQSPQLNSE